MRKKCLYAAALILGTASFVWAAPPGDAKAGKVQYDKSCKMCHGAQGEGNAAVAKMMNVKMLALGSKEVQAKTDAELKKDITAGMGKMNAIKGLSAKQVDDVVAYIRELGKAETKK